MKLDKYVQFCGPYIAENLSRQEISLPIYAEMEDSDVTHVLEMLEKSIVEVFNKIK